MATGHVDFLSEIYTHTSHAHTRAHAHTHTHTHTQILALRILQGVLPSWKKGSNVAKQEQLVVSLLQLLGKTLLLCHSPTMRPGGGKVM